MTVATRLRDSRSVDLLAVGSLQGVGAAARFGFQVALARVLLPASFADFAVALGWTQVIAAAVGGGAGAYLLTSLPEQVARHDDAAAMARYRQGVGWSVATSLVLALGVAVIVHGTGGAGATAAGAAVLVTAGLRSALLATQESNRSLGGLMSSQFLTMILQPVTAVALLGAAALLLTTPIDPMVAAGALGASLAVAWTAQHLRTRARLPAVPPGVRARREPVEWRQLIRLGTAAAMLTWMVEGTVLLSSLVSDDKVALARFAAHVRLSVVTSIAAVSVSTVASTRWARSIREGGGPPSLRDGFRWSALGAGAAVAAGLTLLAVAGPVLKLFGESYTYSPRILGGLVAKDVFVAAASPLFYVLVLTGRASSAARASAGGAVALAAVPIGLVVGGFPGAGLGAAFAGAVWFGCFAFAVARGPRVSA